MPVGHTLALALGLSGIISLYLSWFSDVRGCHWLPHLRNLLTDVILFTLHRLNIWGTFRARQSHLPVVLSQMDRLCRDETSM